MGFGATDKTKAALKVTCQQNMTKRTQINTNTIRIDQLFFLQTVPSIINFSVILVSFQSMVVLVTLKGFALLSVMIINFIKIIPPATCSCAHLFHPLYQNIADVPATCLSSYGSKIELHPLLIFLPGHFMCSQYPRSAIANHIPSCIKIWPFRRSYGTEMAPRISQVRF